MQGVARSWSCDARSRAPGHPPICGAADCNSARGRRFRQPSGASRALPPPDGSLSLSARLLPLHRDEGGQALVPMAIFLLGLVAAAGLGRRRWDGARPAARSAERDRCRDRVRDGDQLPAATWEWTTGPTPQTVPHDRADGRPRDERGCLLTRHRRREVEEADGSTPNSPCCGSPACPPTTHRRRPRMRRH